jgi:hypothetical protein
MGVRPGIVLTDGAPRPLAESCAVHFAKYPRPTTTLKPKYNGYVYT